MLDRAAARLPDVPLHHGDMRGFELGRSFDIVTSLSSAIAWMPTVEELRKAVSTMARHLAPGGLLVIEPWPAPGEESGEGEPWVTSVDEPGRSVVMMETTRLADRRWIQDSHYLIWTARGIEHAHERTELGAFTRDDLSATMSEAGLTVEYLSGGPHGRGLWLGLSPA
jgi:dTDP-3-amino-3,4,6-trideoxy-alpha-D-glucopyranose N,N-dimethyltransferase